MVTKNGAEESNTRYAQGGIAAVMYTPDTYKKHIQDTLIAGAGLCERKGSKAYHFRINRKNRRAY